MCPILRFSLLLVSIFMINVVVAQHDATTGTSRGLLRKEDVKSITDTRTTMIVSEHVENLAVELSLSDDNCESDHCAMTLDECGGLRCNTILYEPVCGCDGKTHINECMCMTDSCNRCYMSGVCPSPAPTPSPSLPPTPTACTDTHAPIPGFSLSFSFTSSFSNAIHS